MGHCQVTAIIVLQKNKMWDIAVTVAAKVHRCLFAIISFMLPMVPLLPRPLEDTYTLSS